MSKEVIDTTNEWAIAEREARKIDYKRQCCIPDFEAKVMAAYTHGFLAGMAFQKQRTVGETVNEHNG